MIEAIKKLLTGENSELIKKIIKKQKEEIEKDYYKNELINEDFLFTMLSKGYIDENYRYYIAKSYDDKFELYESFYINNVKDELEPEFTLEIEHYESVIKEIKDFQWTNPSVLNNDILTYLIQHKFINQLNWFINAILNYYEKYKKNDFIDKYIESINHQDDKSEIINTLLCALYRIIQSNISIETKRKYLLSFFSNNSGPLFCDLLNISTNDDDIIIKLLNSFFENRPSVLAYTLNIASKNDILKNKLSDFKLEIEKLSIYNDSTQQLLIDNAFFQISKDNLDYLIAKQNEIQPHFYYDYIRKNRKLKDKISRSKDITSNSKIIEKFVNEILLTDDKIQISEEGIIDLLFTTLIMDDIAEKVTKKINNEFINLTYLPKFYKENTTSILLLNSNLFHILIEQNKIKIDFNNVLYISSSCTAEDTILFAQKQINRQTQNTSLEKIDTFAKDHFLSSFYNFLLTEQKVNLDLLEKESDFLIKQNIDILKLTTPLFSDNKVISKDKMQTLINLAFRRATPKKSSDYTLLTIIKNEWSYFHINFANIKKRSGNNWILNISRLLMNENNILPEKYVDEILNLISLDDICEIIKLCHNENNSSLKNLTENILNERRFNSLLGKFGPSETIRFIKPIKNIIGYETEDKLKNIIEQKNISQIYEIASKYGLYKNSITDYNYVRSHLDKIIAQLQNNFNFDWEITKNITTLLPNNQNINISFLINNLFILGRYFYDAMENGKIYIEDFFSEKNSSLLNYSKTFPLNPILCGLVFEAYFDKKGKLKKGSKKLFFDQLIEHMEPYKGSKCLNFISECLKLFNNRIVYIPGDLDIIFKVNGNIIDNEIEINSITCFGVELLTKPQDISDTGILAVQGTTNDLINSIREYFTIPKYRIKLKPSFEKYMIKDGMDFIQPLSSIASLINKQKSSMQK